MEVSIWQRTSWTPLQQMALQQGAFAKQERSFTRHPLRALGRSFSAAKEKLEEAKLETKNEILKASKCADEWSKEKRSLNWFFVIAFQRQWKITDFREFATNPLAAMPGEDGEYGRAVSPRIRGRANFGLPGELPCCPDPQERWPRCPRQKSQTTEDLFVCF